jgi:hypothetical protein
MRGEVSETVGRAVHIFGYLPCPEGVSTDDLLLRKPGFLLSAMHSRSFRNFSAAPLVILFFGFRPLQLNQIWRIVCVLFGEEGWGGHCVVCLQNLYLNDMLECLLCYVQLLNKKIIFIFGTYFRCKQFLLRF